MKILVDNFYQHLNKDNLLFTSDNTVIGDNLLTPVRVLGETAKANGITMGTSHILKKEDVDAMIFIDYPSKHNENFEYAIKYNIPIYLITLESPIIKSEVFDKALHQHFVKVFTWSDELVASHPTKYVKINYSHKLSSNFEIGQRERFMAVISGNKISNHPNELYSERLAVINWYEKNTKGDLDLYGLDWDIVIMPNNIIGIFFNKINRTFKLLKSNHTSYKGRLRRKADTLMKYNFSLCFENAFGYDGYITEKVFDSLMAGCIPVYKGAANLQAYIPESCFINYDRFESIEDMHKYLINLSSEQINNYQKAIKDYLTSESAEEFGITKFVNTIINNIVK